MDSNSENDIQIKIDLYLNGSMSESECRLFEKQMQDDDDLRELVLLQKSIGKVLFGETWETIEPNPKSREFEDVRNILVSPEYNEHYQNIKNTGNAYLQGRPKKSQHKKWAYLAGIAASLLVLVAVFVFPQQDQLEELYTTYEDWDELTSYIEQGGGHQEFVRGEMYYREGEYSKAIVIFEDYLRQSDVPLYSAGLIYLGASYFGNGNDSEAIRIFNELVASDAYDSSKGLWYKLLIFLKQKDRVNINATLQEIVKDPNHYNYEKAFEIQESL